MFLVGLTGGISTGKSSVATLLRNMGIEIIDSDVIAREVVQPGKRASKRIRKEFGDSVFHSDGTMNRQAVGNIIFHDPEKRHLLNSIVHPEIYKTIFYRCIKLFFMGHQFTVIDVPLLYESGKMTKYLHKTIVVSCEPEQQLQRLMARDNISESDAMARINSQMPLSIKVSKADYVIMNNADFNDTKQQVEAVVEQLRGLNSHWKYRIIFLGSCIISVAILTVGPYMLYSYLK